MWYYKFEHDGRIIEFKNNSWDGIEHIVVDGIPVSSKFSVMGATHEFTLDGNNCVFIVKVNPISFFDVYLYYYVNRRPIFERVLVRPQASQNSGIDLRGNLYRGKKHLQKWDVDEAITEFLAALDHDPRDYEAMFYLACCYSLTEDVKEGIKYVDAIYHQAPKMRERLYTEEHLAYLRMQPEFEPYLSQT